MPRKEPAVSRRERQILDVLYELGEASALEVRNALPNAPSKNAVRTLLGILETKGHLTHRVDGQTYRYRPRRARQTAGRNALRRVLDTFFRGSLSEALAAHLIDGQQQLTSDEVAQLHELIRQAKLKGKES